MLIVIFVFCPQKDKTNLEIQKPPLFNVKVLYLVSNLTKPPMENLILLINRKFSLVLENKIKEDKKCEEFYYSSSFAQP
jgi:hypothetical protein